MEKLVGAICCACLIAGCATTASNGVVMVGPNTYMIGTVGNTTDLTGSALKALLFKQAEQFCEGQGRAMQPINSAGRDSAIGVYASAEVQFKCVPSESRR